MNQQPASSKRESKWLVPIAITVIGGLIVLAFQLIIQPMIERQGIGPGRARDFLTDYYADVVQPNTRDRAWEKLAPEFQAQKKTGGIDGYRAFWSTIKQVNVADVTPGEAKNEFKARLIYITANGQQRENTIFRLKCIPWYQRLPSLRCQQEHIRIQDTFGTTYPGG